jgi:hypothetical protein
MDFVQSVEAAIPGVQGRVLSVLAQTSAELNLRTLAQLAGVSPAQVSRVVPGLVDLGVLERREVPPASLFRLVPEHLIARTILDLARVDEIALDEMRRLAELMPVAATSIVVFGSFARREAAADSDIDVVVVRPPEVDEEDESWTAGVEDWRLSVGRLTGNRVEVLEVGMAEVASKLASGDSLWQSIRREGLTVSGATLTELNALVDA